MPIIVAAIIFNCFLSSLRVNERAHWHPHAAIGRFVLVSLTDGMSLRLYDPYLLHMTNYYGSLLEIFLAV